MIKIFSEDVNKDFDGTIVDFETIGDFDRRYSDSREYREIIPVIFGTISKYKLVIVYAEDKNDIEQLKTEIKVNMPKLPRPLYAFNAGFERGVLFHSMKIDVDFDGELNDIPYEKKKDAVHKLDIPNYDDPFNDEGALCPSAWKKGEIDKAVVHNRSCLLKERDILLKRGFRKPDVTKLLK